MHTAFNYSNMHPGCDLNVSDTHSEENISKECLNHRTHWASLKKKCNDFPLCQLIISILYSCITMSLCKIYWPAKHPSTDLKKSQTFESLSLGQPWDLC